MEKSQVSPEVLELFELCKTLGDDWNGGDLVNIVTEWFARHGINLDDEEV